MKKLLSKNCKINKSSIKKAVVNNSVDKTLNSIQKIFMQNKNKKF